MLKLIWKLPNKIDRDKADEKDIKTNLKNSIIPVCPFHPC